VYRGKEKGGRIKKEKKEEERSVKGAERHEECIRGYKTGCPVKSPISRDI
jgi:hypothetical protein